MSDEKKDVNSQQENVGKKGINKKLIIAFAGMGAVIVGLVIALILVATSGKKDVDSSASKAESSSAVASETEDPGVRSEPQRVHRSRPVRGRREALYPGSSGPEGRRQGHDGHGDRH